MDNKGGRCLPIGSKVEGQIEREMLKSKAWESVRGARTVVSQPFFDCIKMQSNCINMHSKRQTDQGKEGRAGGWGRPPTLQERTPVC